jgi:hypothetical protein
MATEFQLNPITGKLDLVGMSAADQVAYLKLNQSTPQDITGGQPDFLAGLRAGSTNQFSIDASGNVVTTGTLGAGAITHTGIKDNYRLITSADSLVATDDFVAVTGTTTITLPTAVGITGTVYTIKNTGTAIVTIDADGTETIDGALTYVIRTTNSGVQIISNGANWLVKGVF